MPILNKSQIEDEINSLLPDNVTEEITPSDVRQVLIDITDSALNRTDDENLLNVRDYDSSRTYSIGEGCFYSSSGTAGSTLYRAITTTSGVFNPSNWEGVNLSIVDSNTQVKGGHHQYNTFTEIENIPSNLRKAGMFAFLNTQFNPVPDITTSPQQPTFIVIIGDELFVLTSGSGGIIYVYDVNDDSLLNTIPITGSGSLRYLTHDDTYIYFNSDEQNLYRLNISSKVFDTTFITLGTSCYGAITLNGKLYNYSSNEDAVYVIDLTSWSISSTVTITKANSISGDANRNLVYVGSVTTTDISVIDATTDTVTATISMPTVNNVFTNTITPIIDTVIACGRNANEVYFIDTATNTISQTVSVGTQPINYLVGFGNVYIVNFSSSDITVIKLTDYSVTATIPVSAGPAAAGNLIFHKSTLFVPCYTASKIDAINTITNTVTFSYPTEGNTRALAFHEGTMKLYNSIQSGSGVSVLQFQPKELYVLQSNLVTWEKMTPITTSGGDFDFPIEYTSDISNLFLGHDRMIPDIGYVKTLISTLGSSSSAGNGINISSNVISLDISNYNTSSAIQFTTTENYYLSAETDYTIFCNQNITIQNNAGYLYIDNNANKIILNGTWGQFKMEQSVGVLLTDSLSNSITTSSSGISLVSIGIIQLTANSDNINFNSAYTINNVAQSIYSEASTGIILVSNQDSGSEIDLTHGNINLYSNTGAEIDILANGNINLTTNSSSGIFNISTYATEINTKYYDVITSGGGDVSYNISAGGQFDVSTYGSGYVNIVGADNSNLQGGGSTLYLDDNGVYIYGATSASANSFTINLDVDIGTATFTDGSSSGYGLQYTSDYSSTYTSRSLVDKGYVDNLSTISLSDILTSYTVILSDKDKMLGVNNSSGATITIPNNSSSGFAIGSQISFYQKGLGQITFAPASGVTINSADGNTKTRSQFSSASVIKTDTNTWLLIGDIST